jgi:hypothetical protein
MTSPSFPQIDPSELADLLPHLSPAKRAELDRLLLGGRPLWEPMVNEADPDSLSPQAQAFHSLADEMLFGGAAGGGKTDLLCGLAIRSHRGSIIFRREFRQHKAIIRRVGELLGTRDGFNGADMVWKLGDGRFVEFGAAKDLGDEEAYQGQPHDLIGFDELPHFLESQYRFLTGWLRSTVEGQRCRIVCTGNPPTDSQGDWILSYWGPWLQDEYPNPALPGELRWFAALDGEDKEVESGAPFEHKDEIITPRSRTFIPSGVDDNIYLKRTGYKATLQALPEPLRSKMLKGDFTAGREDDPWQVIPTSWVVAAQERWKYRARPTPLQSSLGVDPARGGADEMIVAPRYDNWVGELIAVPGHQVPSGQDALTLVLSAWRNGSAINVDSIGVGASVFDALRGNGISAHSLVGSQASHARDKSGSLGFLNKRAEWWWNLREDLDPDSGLDVCLPPCPKLKADLCAPRWTAHHRGGIKVEGKGDLMKRLGRSPDRGDAVVYAFVKTSPSKRKTGREISVESCSGYNPFGASAGQ